jgi:hypothetical protein
MFLRANRACNNHATAFDFDNAAKTAKMADYKEYCSQFTSADS